jgi:hypothetical protein
MKGAKFLSPLAIAGYRFRGTPDRPDLKVIEIVTRKGDFPFVATKGMLLRLSEDMAKMAATLTDDRGAN